MPRHKLHRLKKIQIRQSWHKYNLYNLSRSVPPKTTSRTLFQQKWTASSMSRTYHGEAIQEKKWQRMFRGSVRSVVPMNYNYLADHDGSEQAAGRGSGLQRPPDEAKRPVARTPYLNMVYAPLERRLDTAVFRALFASSLRQARQMVIHGWVKVNGKKMVHAGYELNPGDMFQVDPDRVMFATGAPKDAIERRAGRLHRARASKKAVSPEDTENDDPQEASKGITRSEPEPSPEDQAAQRKKSLQALMAQAKNVLANPLISLSAKRKQELRAFQRTVRKTISRPGSNLEADLSAQLQEINSRLSTPGSSTPKPEATPAPIGLPELETPALREELQSLSPMQLRILQNALVEAKENPVDRSKPYATPWQPRAYMSAFAFVPRYLEVHPKICAAVYIRHPVARPGLAEVPSPYNAETLTLAHSWYLRRR